MPASSRPAFVGIDLAWKVDGNHSGVVVLTGDRAGAEVSAVSADCTSLSDVVAFTADHARDTTVAAVDCSLVVTNASGQRPCETMIARAFGRHYASCHSTNLSKPHADVGNRVVRALARHGFVHDFQIESAAQRSGRWLFEVYPHPSMVRLFELDRILAYKKGAVGEKRRGLRTLQKHLGSLAEGRRGLKPSRTLAALLSTDVDALRGHALKRHEDTLDALFCAYLAWHCWRWGGARNRMYGSLSEGYIVVGGEPQPAAAGATTRSAR